METAAKELRERLQDALGSTYTLERELAGGGMSRVFVAREATLGRHVVVKVLPPDAASLLSAERFEREIALVARLQHPHIVPVLAAGVTADGLPFYTMPLVEGESLRGRLDRVGELGVSDAVSVLKDIALALAYAHARGVVHRDIKPDNVLLSGGAAVVTDFGVAKAVDASATSGGTTSLTQLGVALGTPAYMAPEQAAADPNVDHRADLYAFGSLAYELLAGSPPFAGRPTPAVLSAQVNEVPEPIRRRRPTVPDTLAALVMRCLEKRPADRPANADEVLRVLDVAGIPTSVADGVPAGASAIAADLTSSARGWLVPLVTLLLGAGLATVVAWLAWRRDFSGGVDAPVVRVALALDADEQVWDVGCSSYALSPDGHLLVYATIKNGVPILRVRDSDALESRTIDGVRAPRCPIVSPDGRWIAFARGGRLLKVAVDGGPPIPLASPSLPVRFAGATWATPETIVLSDAVTLWAVPSSGGAPRRLSSSDTARGERARMWPQALPDGGGVLYASSADGDPANAHLAVISLDGHRSAKLDVAATYPVGMLAGRLIYVDPVGALKAVPFDARGWRVTGDPVTVLEHVERTFMGAAPLALSRNGTLAYLSGRPAVVPVLLDAQGGRRPLPVEKGAYVAPRYAPDGRRIVFGLGGGTLFGGSVWTYDLAAGTLTRLTTVASAANPEWSPDGRRVLYARGDLGGETALWWQPADGSGSPSRLFGVGGEDIFEGTLAPDARALVYRTSGRGSVQGIFAVSLDSGRVGSGVVPRPLVTATASLMPRLSPDGRWLAYESGESGVLQIYVGSFPGPGGRTQVSIGGGTEPVWARDGRHLFYRDGRRLVDATLRTTPALAVLTRQTFLEGDFDASSNHADYDVAPDGAHVLMFERAGAPPRIVVVHGWVRELLAATRGR